MQFWHLPLEQQPDTFELQRVMAACTRPSRPSLLTFAFTTFVMRSARSLETILTWRVLDLDLFVEAQEERMDHALRRFDIRTGVLDALAR
jgi:hypothetical protein